MSRLSENRTVRERSGSGPPSAEFSIEERGILLAIAHEAIFSAFTGRVPEAAFSPHLSDPRGVFTTLYLDGDLRGCVGYAMPIAPLYRAVSETARAAAFEDSRFLPVTEEEAARLEVSLSVLSCLFPIQAEEVEVGRHGLVVCMGGRRGLLLPQVPAEYDWDRETFLEQTCRKAGLPSDAWRKGATLDAFTAEVFGDGDLSS
ncbi:MAG: AmmeMemoRadiSam system protein A [Acidobacteriia bacterium]|nr:AmmeMemoRadiSam system protein A [Terriglobia bacterium]